MLDYWLEDTRQMLQIITEENAAGPQQPGTIPVTLDISGMYSNVPWTDGMRAFEEAMDNRDKKDIPTAFLMSLVMLVLSCNLFVFDGILFHQLFGLLWEQKLHPRLLVCLWAGWN